MKKSIGFIGTVEDELVAGQIEFFLRNLEGFELVYFTHSKSPDLYIVKKERLDKLMEDRNDK